ncbi:hypothetical protein C0991_002095 [Blastosporella zonata]|nr:hypothetical protein C0991_002095 [Blastosporella zonata]
MPSIVSGHDLDITSDAIDEVNILKGRLWDEESEFDKNKEKHRFRDYDAACDRVKNFYKEQHEKQTVEFNIQARVNFKKTTRARMGIWEAMEMLNTLIDESDPDVGIFTVKVPSAFLDIGSLLVVGCKFSDKIIYPETFVVNPDYDDAIYSTKYGIYQPHCGLDNVMLSWGHDEYLYHVLKDQSTLPDEALAMIRYHSFYPWHREGAYSHLTNDEDERLLAAVRAFNPYDLYSKSDVPCEAKELRPYYEKLIAKFFPPIINCRSIVDT